MTSKNLFSKQLVQELKRRLWSFALIAFAMVMFIPIAATLEVESVKQMDVVTTADLVNFFGRFFNITNGLISAVVIGTAILCGIQGFTYLNSKKQIDFYHSMPVKRERLFIIKLVAGIITFVVPYMIAMALGLVVAVVNGGMAGIVLKSVLWTVLFDLVYFLIIYVVTMVAMMLTGHIVVNLIAVGVLFAYSPLISLIIQSLKGSFFSTFSTDMYEVKLRLSPIQDMWYWQNEAMGDSNIYTIEGLNKIDYSKLGMHLLLVLFGTIILTAVAIFLYKKRPSEAAGKSIAFKIGEPILKTLITVPGALVCGYLFMAMSADNSFGWFLFGLIVSFIVLSMIMEIIYSMDFKAALAHKRQFLINAVVVAFIVVSFKCDIFGFDTYIPKKDSVVSMAISIDNLDSNMNYYNGNYNYYSAAYYRLNHMNTQDIDSIYDIAEIATSNVLTVDEYYYSDFSGVARAIAVKNADIVGGSDGPTSTFVAGYDTNESAVDADYYIPITIAYRLKSGRNVYRTYNVDSRDEQVMTDLNNIYLMPEYKEAVFPFLGNPDINYAAVECISNYEDDTKKLSADKAEQLYKVYYQDMMSLSLNDVINTLPVGMMQLLTKSEYGYDYDSGYPVYAKFEPTLAMLDELGATIRQTVDASAVSEIVVSDYNQEIDMEADEDNLDGYTSYYTETYTSEEPEKIQEILDNITNESLVGNYFYSPVESSNLEVTVNYVPEGKNEFSQSQCFVFNKGAKPSFVGAK